MINNFGIYIVKDWNKDVKYIGSSCLALESLEFNHRNWKDKPGYSSTDFREALVAKGENWTFEWLVEPRMTNNYSILIDEGVMIRHYNPELNKKGKWGQFPLAPRLIESNNGFIKQEERVYI